MTRSACSFTELSKETMESVFSPNLEAEEDSTLPFKFISCRQLSPFFFSGAHSPFTPTCQDTDITIDGEKYSSVDHYVWRMKFIELTGFPCKGTNFRAELNKLGVSQRDLEMWFLRRGLLYMQKGILEKVTSDQSFYHELMKTGNKYIIYTYVKEHFYATGTPMHEIQDWINMSSRANFYIKLPLRFPVIYQDLQYVPWMPNNGHNVLGLIYMALREAILAKGLHNLSVVLPDDKSFAISPYSKTIFERRRNCTNGGEPGSNFHFLEPFPPQTRRQSESTGYARSDTLSRNSNDYGRQSSCFNTPNTEFESLRVDSRSTTLDKHPFRVPKQEPEEQEYRHTYSTMSTPLVSPAASAEMNPRNWRSANELEMIRQAEERISAERLAHAGETPNSETIERQNQAIEALNDDDEFVQQILLAHSERITNLSAMNTPTWSLAEETSSTGVLNRQLKRENTEHNSSEQRPCKRRN